MLLYMSHIRKSCTCTWA